MQRNRRPVGTSDYQTIVERIENLNSAAVVCAGDVMLDHFVYGEVTRISPEAPIPVIRIDKQQSMLGGAGNAVRNLCALGARVHFHSIVGNDSAAQTIMELLTALPECQAGLECEPGYPTTVKTRYIAHGQQLLRADIENGRPIDTTTLDRALISFSEALAGCTVVLLSDYAKGMLNDGHVREFIRLARAAGRPVIVDPKGRDFTRYQGATLLKPNLKEISEATGLPTDTEASIETAARALLTLTQAEYVLVTRGSSGMMLIPAAAPALSFHSMAREIYDVSGAGDTVAAVLAAGIGSGLMVEDAVEIANIAAAIVVGKIGTATVDRAEIIHEVQHRSLTGTSSKVLQRPEAIERVHAWQHMGLRVGFASGRFDMLHAGHTALLEAARRQCDRLIVGVQGDRSLSGRNSPDRPMQDEFARSLVMASLGCVDTVVIFEEETPEELIRALRPDVLVRDSDNSSEHAFEADLVRSWGGELLVADPIPGRVASPDIQRFTAIRS